MCGYRSVPNYLFVLLLCVSIMFEKDAGHKVFMDDVYENESRMPGGTWSPASIPWTDIVRQIHIDILRTHFVL